MKTEQRHRDIQNGLLVLILVVFALFYANTGGFNSANVSRGEGSPVRADEISPFQKITLGIPLSINRETEEGLTAVPGIGPVTANAIVKERTRRGGFKTIEELKSVRGIGDKTYSRIRAYVTL